MSGSARPIPAGEVKELLSALIRNACVNDGTADSGDEHRSVATLQSFFGEPGRVFEARPGRQSILYRLPGTNPSAPALLLMGHLDVVPVTDGWSVDPFEGQVRDGFVWGRGAIDMLNLTAAMAAVFRRHLHGERPPLPGDLVYLAVADEEAGGTWGARYLVESHWEAVVCEYLLTEIAYPAIATAGGPAHPVTVAEKGPYWRRLRVSGTPGHASQPYGSDNALVPLARALSALGAAPTPVVLSDEWRAFVAELELPEDEAAALLDPELIDQAVEDLASDSVGWARYVHACTHLTVSPTVFEAGSKANVIPADAEALVDVRALPGQDGESVDDHLRKAMGRDADRIRLEPVMDHPAGSSPGGTPLWEAIVDALEISTGSRRVLPTITPATTDARFFRDRGVVCYGVGLFDDRVSFADFLSMFHGIDERVTVESLGLTAHLLDEVVAGFGRRTRSSST